MRGIHALVFCAYLFIHLLFVKNLLLGIQKKVYLFFVVVARSKKTRELRKNIFDQKTKQKQQQQQHKTKHFLITKILEFKINIQTQNEL